MLGHEADQVRRPPRPRRPPARRCARSPTRFGFDVDPDALVDDLPVGVQQRVEIIKALSRDAKVLVFDEPTAVLTPQETDELMVIMRQLRDAGTSIVFITHKLREVREVADRITVIRLGKVVGEASPTATQRRARLAHGRPRRRADRRTRSRRRSGDDGPRGREPHRSIDPHGQLVVNNVSFEVRARRDPRDRRRAGQRPDRAHRGDPRPAAARHRRDHLDGKRARRARACARSSTPASASCPRTAPRTASSPSSRSPRTSCSTAATAARSCKRGNAAARATSPTSPRRRSTEFDIRTQGIDDPRRPALRRQPAEGRARPRAQPRPAPVRRRAADPRPRRRLDRVRAHAHRRDPRRRHAGDRRLDRARRGRRARRPHRGHVPRRASSASCPATPRATSSAS